MKTHTKISISILAALLVACGDEANQLNGGPGGGGDPGGPAPAPTDTGKPGDPGDPAQCAKGRDYLGFGAKQLAGGRVVAKLGVDRGRLKPFGALQTEY